MRPITSHLPSRRVHLSAVVGALLVSSTLAVFVFYEAHATRVAPDFVALSIASGR